jgi:hypothetical protein
VGTNTQEMGRELLARASAAAATVSVTLPSLGTSGVNVIDWIVGYCTAVGTGTEILLQVSEDAGATTLLIDSETMAASAPGRIRETFPGGLTCTANKATAVTVGRTGATLMNISVGYHIEVVIATGIT